VCNDSVLPSKRHIADEEDDDYDNDERGDDDNIANDLHSGHCYC
jgi:hypothetical protein